MSRLKITTCFSLLGVLLLTTSVTMSQRSTPEAQHSSPKMRQSSMLPEGEGKALLEIACSQCHRLNPILMRRDGLQGWQEIVEDMVFRGAQLNAQETDAVVQYLFQHFGPGMQPMVTGTLPPNALIDNNVTSGEISLPQGEGRDLTQAICQSCHDLGRVVSLRRTQQEWREVTENMTARGMPASAEQKEAIVSYLTRQFGK